MRKYVQMAVLAAWVIALFSPMVISMVVNGLMAGWFAGSLASDLMKKEETK